MNRCFFNDNFSKEWVGKDPFAEIYSIEGEIFRNVKNRKTFRFEMNNLGYFAKIHRNIGWREIFKNLFQFKKPVIGATNEYLAIRKLEELGLDTMEPCAYAERGLIAAYRESFLITAELNDCISLEDLCANWGATPPKFREKLVLLELVAHIVGTMHRAGINHRDCYICHFLLKKSDIGNEISPRLYVIDLHRAQIRDTVPYRYVIKDVAGIWFSAMNCGITRNDKLRFMREYSNKSLRNILSEDLKFWKDVDSTAKKLFEKEQRKKDK